MQLVTCNSPKANLADVSPIDFCLEEPFYLCGEGLVFFFLQGRIIFQNNRGGLGGFI